MERNPITTVTVASAVLAASRSFKAELTVERQRVGGDPVQPTTILKLCRFGLLQHANYIAQCSICPENSLTFPVQLIFAEEMMESLVYAFPDKIRIIVNS